MRGVQSETHEQSNIRHSTNGEVIACVEKNKVSQENFAEILQLRQDALEDAVLMGCDAQQLRAVLEEMPSCLVATFLPER